MKKRISALLLALVMVMSLLAACGGQTGTGSTKPADTTTPADPSTPA